MNSNTLHKNRFLSKGENLISTNQSHILEMQEDGNLIVFKRDGQMPIWASNSHGFGHKVVLEGNGVFYIYNHIGDKKAISSFNATGDKLVLENNGNLILYNESSQPVWNSLGLPNLVEQPIFNSRVISEEAHLEIIPEKIERNSNLLYKKNIETIPSQPFIPSKLTQEINVTSASNAPIVVQTNKQHSSFSGLPQLIPANNGSNSSITASSIKNKEIEANSRIEKRWANPAIAVALYPKAQFEGKPEMFGKGTFNANHVPRVFNSIRVKPGYSIELYENIGFDGQLKIYKQSTSDLSDLFHKVNSLKISQNIVTIFANVDYKGTWLSLNEGSYDVKQLDIISDNQISSIKILPGYYIEAFESNNFDESKRTIVGNTPNLGNFNNRISSIIIKKGIPK